MPTADFRLFYDVGGGALSTRVLSYRPSPGDDGYFLLLASPEIKSDGKKSAPKTVILVIDRSGSMSGKKIEQVREALKHVLNNVVEVDLFNIVAYDGSVETFRPELQRFTDETRNAALGFVEGLYAGGSTNIDAALNPPSRIAGFHATQLRRLLTDACRRRRDERDEHRRQNAREYNRVRARPVRLRAGYDVNSACSTNSPGELRQSGDVRPTKTSKQIQPLYTASSAGVDQRAAAIRF